MNFADEIRDIVRQERSFLENKEDVTDPKTWCPGDMMAIFDESSFFAVGLVVAHDGNKLTVVWPPKCRIKMQQYDIIYLNKRIIKKVT